MLHKVLLKKYVGSAFIDHIVSESVRTDTLPVGYRSYVRVRFNFVCQHCNVLIVSSDL